MFLKYEVDWYYDQEVTSKGFVQAHSFAEAAAKIEADYENIETIRIAWVSDGDNCLDYNDIVDVFEENEQGAGSQVFEAIKEGLKEAIAIEKE